MNHLLPFTNKLLLLVVLFTLSGLVTNKKAGAQVVLGPVPATYTQDYNTLSSSGTSSVMPAGWLFTETGSGANLLYNVNTGSSNSGDSYSAGNSADRAFGGLRSGSVVTTFGCAFSNSSGSTITQLDITYTGEQWRLGATSRVDQLDFQYSTDATSLNSGTWTDVNALDFTSPYTGTAGARDGNAATNRTLITSSITGLSIPSGTTFYIRWNDVDASSADDLLTVDDFTLTAHGGTPTTITTDPITGSPFNTTCSAGSSVSVPFTSSGTFNAANVYTAQLSNASGSFASPLNIGTLSGNGNSGVINSTIPSGTTAGTGYRIRVVSSSPIVSGTDNGTDLTITYTCNLSTDPITGSPFTLTCSGSASVSVPFTASSAFGAGNTYTAQLSNATGSFASPVVIGTLTSSAASGTITATIPPGTTPGTGYRIRVIGSAPAITGTDNGTNLTIDFDCTLSTGTISGSPFTISCSAGSAVSVPYTISTTPGAGNVFTAQLSNATGSFASPVNIGTLSSTATSGTITATIPVSTSSGTGYRIRVIASNPSVTGTDNGANLTVTYTCSALVINEIYINAVKNDGSPNPNLGEWVELYNGTGAAIDLSCFSICDGDFCVTFPPGSTIAAGGFFTIGSTAGSACATCDFPGITFDVDWGTCGCTSGTTVGTFTNGNEQLVLANSAGSIIDAVIWGGGQDLPITMNTASPGSCSSVSVAMPSAGSSTYENIGVSGDGQSHERDTDGSMTWQTTGTPTFAGTNNPPLPVELISFKGYRATNGNLLEWSTATEINNSHFEPERSLDGKQFEPIGKVTGHGTTSLTHHYTFPDKGFESLSNITYYRLKQVDYNGHYEYSEVIYITPVNRSDFFTYQDGSRLFVKLDQPASYSMHISLVSVTGQQVASSIITESETSTVLDIFGASGIYFISIESGQGRVSKKVILR